MIAVAENQGRTVCLYHRLSSYISGREPVAFATGLSDTDAGIADLGWGRVKKWEPIEGTAASWAPVRRADA